MAFTISKNLPTFSEDEKLSLSQGKNEAESVNSVTTHLYLKSSSAHTSKSLDKDEVLRRIRYHKCLYKLRSTFHALLSTSSSSSPEHAANTVSAHHEMWLQQGDAFSAP